VRGMFLHPRQAQAAIGGVPGIARFRLVIDRVDERDALGCEVVATPDADHERLAAEVRERIRSGLRFNADVAVVEAIDENEPVIVDQRTWT
jgi:phenylacetate-CoA ligase